MVINGLELYLTMSLGNGRESQPLLRQMDLIFLGEEVVLESLINWRKAIDGQNTGLLKMGQLHTNRKPEFIKVW